MWHASLEADQAAARWWCRQGAGCPRRESGGKKAPDQCVYVQTLAMSVSRQPPSAWTRFRTARMDIVTGKADRDGNERSAKHRGGTEIAAAWGGGIGSGRCLAQPDHDVDLCDLIACGYIWQRLDLQLCRRGIRKRSVLFKVEVRVIVHPRIEIAA